MENREEYEVALKNLRRLNGEELEQIGSLIAKKVRVKSEVTDGEDRKILAVDFESFIKNNAWKGPINIIGAPKDEFFAELKSAVDKGYSLAIVTPRIKYEGGEEAVFAWFRNNNCPSPVYNKLHMTCCIPFGVNILSSGERVLYSAATL